MEFLLLRGRRSTWRNVPNGEERGEMVVFIGYRYFLYYVSMFVVCLLRAKTCHLSVRENSSVLLAVKVVK